MRHFNVEIKARCKNQGKIRDILKSKNADFRGVDHQVDTYFKVVSGRLKLREGKIENVLVFYNRQNKKGPKESQVILFESDDPPTLKEILAKSLGILAVVDKQREIYFIDNIKFHIDKVKNLGTFVEIEAIDEIGKASRQKLLKQCRGYLKLFDIKPQDLVSKSYGDLILKRA